MPPKAGTSTIHSASAARASAHPYAAAQSNARASRRTLSIDEKPVVAGLTVVSPTAEVTPGPSASRSRKKTGSVSQLPKSSRQQFSACHACRYRRVKCDLKDLSTDADINVEISCTNCRERGIRCKDDYAESKKQLRRGKRINQLELEDNILDNNDDSPSYSSPHRPRTHIPALTPEFFDSPFYRRFHVQRPIIDPIEFRSRYVAWLQHQLSPESNAALSSAAAPLSVEGQLLAKLLVVWAAAYGVDESGIEQPENSYQDVQKRRNRVKNMIEEVIHIIDNLGLLRKPSWDGVRCLLMTLPLTEDVLVNPMDRLAMYEAAVQQVYTLCQHDGVATGLSSETRAANALVRVRIFWYAHVHEGLTTGLRGGRLLMDDDDLKQFHQELPPASAFMGNRRAVQSSNMTYSLAFQYATAPIRLASACRKVHAALTGPKARAAKRLDGKKLEETWEALTICWEEFEGLRNIQRSDYVSNEDTTRFVDGWQIFLFECYNVIQEKIRDRLDTARAAQITELDENPDSPATVEALVHDLKKYLAIAEAKCYDVLDHVLQIIRRHLGSSFFAYDASLVRDGCFFAGHTLALMPNRDEDVKVCLQALSEMRWAFSKGHERSQTIRLAWKSRSDLVKQSDKRSPESELIQMNDAYTPPGGHHQSNSSPATSHSRATPPGSTYPPQHQQVHVSSLPTHSAPGHAHNPSQTFSRPGANPGIHRQHSGHIPNMSVSTATGTLDTPSQSYADPTAGQGYPNGSPTRAHAPAKNGHPSFGASSSVQSSSSDGSSPPELGSQTIAYSQLGMKSPVDFDPTQYSHQPMHGDGSLPASPTRVRPPNYGMPSQAAQGQQHAGSHVGYTQQSQVPRQQYMTAQNAHTQAMPQSYQSHILSNGSEMHGHSYPLPSPSHSHGPVGYHHSSYSANPPTLTPDEMSHYTNGGDYFPSYIPHNQYSAPSGATNGVLSAAAHDSNTYLTYPDYYTQR